MASCDKLDWHLEAAAVIPPSRLRPDTPMVTKSAHTQGAMDRAAA
jgi:hypothetical protein